MVAPVPDCRVSSCNDAPIRPDNDYVVYWMIAFRRPHYSFALQRAAWRAERLGKPLLVLEPLRIGYRWACPRFHRFVMDGMADNRRAFERAGVNYCAYVEPEPGAGRGLLKALADRACVVVTDDYPCFFLPRMVGAAAERLGVRLEKVDSNGLLPLREPDRGFTRAYSLRRYLQKRLRPHLDAFPEADPLVGLDLPRAELPDSVHERWPAVDPAVIEGDGAAFLAQLDIDQRVGPVGYPGGAETAEQVFQDFLERKLERYAEGRNRIENDPSSGLSPWLHFGHISTHRIVAALFERADWSPEALGQVTGKSTGWWGLPEGAEKFLDELVTWRELGFLYTHQNPDEYDRFDSLPSWAIQTLGEHADDPRDWVYDLETFASAATHDELWNAAQRQLRRDGRIHNYLRMLWGKKILHWSASPQEALAIMIELNNRYAVDGRDPNSYSGIFWTLGRFDRAWGPERPIFGKVRYMTVKSTRRKMNVDGYLKTYGPAEQGDLLL